MIIKSVKWNKKQTRPGWRFNLIRTQGEVKGGMVWPNRSWGQLYERDGAYCAPFVMGLLMPLPLAFVTKISADKSPTKETMEAVGE